jgi:hypothetical protein
MTFCRAMVENVLRPQMEGGGEERRSYCKNAIRDEQNPSAGT